jgi:predicted HicB family RNase H-like nuclease
MKQLKLNLPDEVHAVLVELAKQQQRSLHAQIVFVLQQVAQAATADKRREGL